VDGDLDQILLVVLGFFAALTLLLVLVAGLEDSLDRPGPVRGLAQRIRELVRRSSRVRDSEEGPP
jgi:hypothetical protein